MRVVLGNRDAVSRTAVENEDGTPALNEDGTPVRKVTSHDGKRATVIDMDDEIRPGVQRTIVDAFHAITDPDGVNRNHFADDAKPAWVASDNEALASLLAANYGCEVRELETPDFLQPPTYGGDAPAPSGATVGVLGAAAATQAMLLLATIAFLRSGSWLKTNAGHDFQAKQMAGAASATAVAKFMALTANTTTPVVGDTTLTAEIATASGGLIRQTATYAHTGGTNTYTLTGTFTANGSDSLPVTIGKMGVFDASSSGNMPFATLISPTATLSASGDVLTVTQTVTM